MRLVAGLADGGVPIAFGLDDPRGFFAALRRSELVKPAVIHDERAGGFMADGYARVSGRPVACAGISGPGAVNLAPALLEAWASSVPLVAVVGEFLPPTPERRAFQEAEHALFLGRGLTKLTIEARASGELYSAARKAAEIATSERPRPVLLLVSDSLLWREVGAEVGLTPTNGEEARPLKADAALIREASERLASAERPVILAGTGVNIARAQEQLLEVARRYGAPVATSMSGKGAIHETDPLALGVAGAYTSGAGSRGAIPRRLLREADVILAVGCDLDALTTCDWSWPGDQTQLIRVDIDEQELTAFPGTHLHGDAAAVLGQIATEASVPLPEDRHAWLDRVAAEVRENSDRVASSDLARTGSGTVWPGALMQEIAANLSPADYVVADASYSSAWVLDRIVQRRAGRQVLAPRGVGTLGWGLPAAMGVQLADPGAQVTCVTGDGAFFYGLPEMETAARWCLGLTVVLLRNGVYGSQRQSNLLAQDKDYDDLHFGASMNHCELARAMGWSAVAVDSLDDFAEARETARRSPEPWLIEVSVDPEARPPLTKFDLAADGATSDQTPSALRGNGVVRHRQVPTINS
jgi:acetolactate synthase-1/2/3 large subunit